MTRTYAALAFLLLVGSWFYGQRKYAAGQADCEAAHTAVVAQAAAARETVMVRADQVAQQITDAGSEKVAAATEATHETVRTITRIVHDTPAAGVCAAPAASVRELTGAVERANATARGVQ